MLIQVLGIDLGKSCFHIVGHDAAGNTQFKKKLSRSKLCEFLANHPKCIVAFEACGGSHWLARKCRKFDHKPKVIPPQFVKAYLKGNKNDFNDAEAIAEAATRPNMHFVPIKSENAQVIAAIHRFRSGYIKERTACMSRIGAVLLEFGMSLPQGHATMKRLFQWLAKQSEPLHPMLIQELQHLHEHYQSLNERIAEQDRKLKQLLDESELGQLLRTIPGVGDMTASACLAAVSSPSEFKNGRHMAAWLGLVPKQYSTGGKPKLLGISKRGNTHLRTLFIHGARAVLSRVDKTGAAFGNWLVKLKAEKPFNVAVVALANKMVRIAWAVMLRGTPFEATTA
jgi:transposase